ncbi:SIR2 family protein [Cochleicola gelatinilyticus]|uniref:Uncharacterized protein n=1 Tax=Cochleicola gelatinilyticus TaxID=1763537 RepID=A0A167HAL5_9FLAO|nr:SIR2 family protein [Cochleicola gelatinilyticus]OAB78407.1 hypothetical protein ULVI_10545 [Cochleicola gelatinilyticus]
MYTISNLQQELKNKERSVNDLIRYIGTRNDHNPNYSLLLGAGCSVTSGIKSASTLIGKWEKEIYLQDNPEITEFNSEEAEQYFKSQMWFDSRNAYSSLFEKKYDLPRQRRMFIEKAVRDKLPSIGYAYLIKLVENNYLKTLFTTNFDDLLNEAFYQYSNERPILCAHDSSINSITITSKRPKIIKLHGDYLFDDIKSTLRETESLEENIKNKFIEFSKDYGLIVVGYGGNDRSIIDILTYLLKNEEYFKNGIYWCLREDSEINEDLRKLLWKDRVYYVKIDGYDEFMAEVHSNLNDDRLPIDSSYLSQRKNEVINQLVSNSYFKNTNCSFISKDFERLNKAKDKDIITNFFQYLDQKEDDSDLSLDGFRPKKNFNEELSDEDRNLLKNINQDLFTSNYELVNEQIDEKFEILPKKSDLYKSLLGIKGKCLRNLNKEQEAIVCYEELIEIDKENIDNYIILSNLKNDFQDKVGYIEKAIELEPYISRLYYEKSKLLFDHYNEVYNASELDFDLTKIDEIINKGIALSPIISNPGWILKVNIIEELNDDKDKAILEIEEIIKKLEIQDLFHASLIKLKVYLSNFKDQKNKDTYDLIEKSIPKQRRYEHKKELEMMLLKEYKLKNDKDSLKTRFKYLENTYELDNDYWEFKAVIQLEKFQSLDDAIFTLENIKNKNKGNYSLLFNYLLYKNNISGATMVNEKHLGNDKLNQSQILTAEGEYKLAIDLIRELKTESPYDTNLNVHESFLLLKLEKYQEAFNFTQKCLKPSNHTEPYFLVNYFLAKKHYRQKEKPEKIREKLLNGKNEKSIIEVAAYCLMGDYKEVKTKLNILLQTDYSYKYQVNDWPLFNDFIKSSQFKHKVA